VFLTNYYSTAHPYLDMETLSKQMAHSVQTALTDYVKIDAPK
jgi:hypothetical protein